MTEPRPYPPVRFSRFEAWRKRIVELDEQIRNSAMTNEEWSRSPEARLVRDLRIALDNVASAQPHLSRFGFVDLSPLDDNYRDQELRGADLVDRLVQVTGIPKSRQIITGETFNRWWKALDELEKTDQGPSILRSPAGVTWSTGTTKYHLDRAAEDYTKTVEEWSESGDRRMVRVTDHPLVELSSMDDEEEVPLLIREAERYTGIPAE